MQRSLYITLVVSAIFFLAGAAADAQIQNVNIGGSYSGTFMISGSGSAEYEIAGSPYLSETWMYGTLEMKSEVVEETRKDREVKNHLKQYEAMIAKIDAVLERLSDPGFDPAGLVLNMEPSDHGSGEEPYDLRIPAEEFEGVDKVARDLREKLRVYFEQLKGDYEAQMNDFFKLKGLFRYNLYAQEFEMVHNRDTFAITAPFNIRSISISNMEFMYGLYVKRSGRTPKLGSAYFQVLSNGKVKLLRRHDVSIKAGGGPVTHNWAGGADAFVQYQQLYYQSEEGGEVVLLKNPGKCVRDLFSDHSEEMESFIRSRGLNLRKDQDLATVFEYYNSLET